MPNNSVKLHISVITLFPDIFIPHLDHLPIKRGVDKNLVKIDFVNLRNYAIDERGTVDSPAYGGGPGMILRPEPIFNAINSVINDFPANILFLTPKGKNYNQDMAYELSVTGRLVIVCGRYEGIDQRVIDYFCNLESAHAKEVSIGNYVLSGGEVPAMVIIESIVRLIPGAIENSQALDKESFTNGKLEHPQYSRPEKWMDLSVPKTLITGHHKNVADWKEYNSPKY